VTDFIGPSRLLKEARRQSPAPSRISLYPVGREPSSTIQMQATWDLAETQRLIDHPAVRLVRSPNCALTDILHRRFKDHHAFSVHERQTVVTTTKTDRPSAFRR
jgi:hypothetical protein